MPNHPYDSSANYTGQWQAIEMLIFQADRLVLSWDFVEVKYILFAELMVRSGSEYKDSAAI